VLHPAWALADLLSQTDWGTFGLWPDDIDWLDLTPEDEAQWQKACQALALPAIGLLDLVQAPRTHGPIVCAAKNSPPPPTPSKAS
jgi:hypothetical protein